MIRIIRVAVAVCAIALSVTAAEARQRRAGYGFSCGIFLSKLLGVERTPLALDWAKKFSHTSARNGAVVVQRRRGRALGGGPGGHVSLIKEVTGQCTAIVRDNRGTYERDICTNLVAYVDPS